MSHEHVHRRKSEHPPHPQLDLQDFLTTEKNHREIVRRATVILDITDNDDPYLRMFRLEANDFTQAASTSGDDLRHKQIARIRAQRGVGMLEKLIADETFTATRKPREIFQDILHQTLLRNSGHAPVLSLVRSVIESFPPETTNPQGLELFAATIGFAQEYIIQQHNATGDKNKKYRHAIRSHVFSYARSVLQITGNGEFLSHIAQPHRDRRHKKN